MSDPPTTAARRGLTAIEPLRQVFDETLGRAPNGTRMAGRAVLVLGAGQRSSPEADPPLGNGRAIALMCAREGASVACVDINAAAGNHTVEAIKKAGGNAYGMVADAAVPEQIEKAVADAIRLMGHLDGMVLNVGIGGPSGLADQTVDLWDAAMSVNLRGHMWACKTALPLMAPGGAIVFISSTASLRPGTRVISYDTSKAALAALCRHVALEGEPLGIRANVLAPGPIDTPLGRDASRRRPTRAVQRLAFGREGTAWEVAYAATFLLSHEASFVNAQVIVADGGITGLQLR